MSPEQYAALYDGIRGIDSRLSSVEATITEWRTNISHFYESHQADKDSLSRLLERLDDGQDGMRTELAIIHTDLMQLKERQRGLVQRVRKLESAPKRERAVAVAGAGGFLAGVAAIGWELWRLVTGK